MAILLTEALKSKPMTKFHTSIPSDSKEHVLRKLAVANKSFQKIYPGDRPDRQPVHTVYGGADLFKHDSAEKMAGVALRAFLKYAPDYTTFSEAIGLSNENNLAERTYNKVINKLRTEAVEDFRIDFEDGFGNRSWEEEDRVASEAAWECAKGMELNSLPPFIGIRIKPFTEDLKERGIRTLDIFLSTLSQATNGALPENFVVMLPKVTIPEQIKSLVRLFEIIEDNSALQRESLKMEMMVETTQSIVNSQGVNPLRSFLLASKGRMIASAFGTYDYTASNNITAHYQDMGHPVCDFAHHYMKLALGATGIWLSDGATNVMPIGPHRGDELSEQELAENQRVVHNSWKKAFNHTRHSLFKGLYQGWDLHPAQFPMRYAAVYSFFLESYEEAAERLKAFVDRAARATLTGDIFDDAATGQGLLNYFLRGLNCGAISVEDALETGLTIDELRSRSFLKILEGRLE